MSDDIFDGSTQAGQHRKRNRRAGRKPGRFLGATLTIGFFTVLLAMGALLGVQAYSLKDHLEAASGLVPQLKREIEASDSEKTQATATAIRNHTSAARSVANDPLWTLASGLPWVGSNFSAVSEVARSADDISTLGLAPLAAVYQTLDWNKLLPTSEGTDLEALKTAAPKIKAAAYAVQVSSLRLDGIEPSELLPQVATPLKQATEELRKATVTLNSAADAASIAPTMLGGEGPQNYLLMIQNNAELRASGGIPGALAVVSVDRGKITFGAQSSANALGVMSPPLAVDQQQQHIFSTRLGKYMQDVNLTPDFPTAAATAAAMWENKHGQRVDGVIAIDPVVLSYILQATGPVVMSGPELADARAVGLPSELNGNNVVQTLLSDVYAKIHEPRLQDSYFAALAKEVFSALSSGRGEAKGVITGIAKGTDERRVLVWSANPSVQSVISQYALGGSVEGPSVSPAQFGVYFNDGTGAKMDYYVQRKVQLVKACPADGYEETAVRVTSTNTAPADAATSLPEYVTGGGIFGVPAGTVQTNIVVYGPAQANIESAKADGQRTAFAPYQHGDRPVGVLAQRLAPGESKTVEFTFGKIVQHAEPNVVVTPTVQPVKEVTVPTENASCG